MAVFFVIVFIIYSLANLYLFVKVHRALPSMHQHNVLFPVIFFSLAFIFIIAKILEARHSSVIADILNVIGGFWLAFMLYGFLFFIASDIIFLLLKLTRALHTPENVLAFRKWTFIVTAVLSTGLIIGGFINAILPVVKKYDITIGKDAGEVRNLKIAAVSDIHLGSVIRKRSIRKLSSILEELKPDMVLLLGDILDGEIGPVMRDDLLKYFTCPKCTNGLLAITGNHEFIGGAAKTIPYIESKGIKLLLDEVVTIEGGIQFIGRKDRDSEFFYKSKRMTLPDLVAGTDPSKPVILLDHQPANLDDAVKNGIDLELSGHTHNGQMWPLNRITRLVWELSYGYLKKGNTQFIVSSGYGLWGPRVRSGSRSEVLLLNIHFAGPAVK
jgi:predicted MPP superfamily phosphohydrolase